MRRALGWLVIAAIAAGALIVLEVGLRIAFPAMDCQRQPPLWEPNARVGWSLVPGAVAEAAVCDGAGHPVARNRIQVNALGQRDRSRDLTRRPGVPRVVVLGDSFVEALQVGLDETFLARVEATSGIEMVNLGVSGYSSDNELRAFLTAGRRYRPDAVIVAVFIGNDVLENGARLYLKSPHGLPPKRWLRSTAPSLGLRACLAIHRAVADVAAMTPRLVWTSSRIVRALLTQGVSVPLSYACDGATGPTLAPGVPEILGVYDEPETVAWREGWSTTERLLTRLDRRVRATGARFGVVVVPMAVEIDPRQNPYFAVYPTLRTRTWEWDYPQRRLRAFLERAGIPVLPLESALRDHWARTGRLGYYPWDGHWDPDGHAVVADAVVPFVSALLSADRPSR